MRRIVDQGRLDGKRGGKKCGHVYVIDIHIKKYKEEPNSLGKNKICVEELKCSELKMGVNIA